MPPIEIARAYVGEGTWLANTEPGERPGIVYICGIIALLEDAGVPVYRDFSLPFMGIVVHDCEGVPHKVR